MTPNCAGTWDAGCTGPGGQIRWFMDCESGGPGLVLNYVQYSSNCPTGTIIHNDHSGVLSPTTNPFSVPTITFPAAPLGWWTDAYSLGYRSVTITDPSFTQYCCWVYFVVTGCNSAPAPGVTVTIWTNSSKTTQIATGITDSSGSVDLNIENHAGSIYYEVGGARWATSSATITVTCGQYNATTPRTVSLAAASGYVCNANCANPIATTLHGTHPKFGAITYNYNAAGSLGAGWYATVTYSYPGCFACPAKTATVTCFMSAAFAYQERWKST